MAEGVVGISDNYQRAQEQIPPIAEPGEIRSARESVTSYKQSVKAALQALSNYETPRIPEITPEILEANALLLQERAREAAVKELSETFNNVDFNLATNRVHRGLALLLLAMALPGSLLIKVGFERLMRRIHKPAQPTK